MQMLRTIHKNTSKVKAAPQANLSSLGSKWKQMQASFGFDEAPVPGAAVISPQTSPTDPSDPFTPLSGSECTRIERIPRTSENNTSLIAKSAAVIKVLEVSRNVLNLSTSPSGRLDALVPHTESHQQDVAPRLQLNDRTINVSGSTIIRAYEIYESQVPCFYRTHCSLNLILTLKTIRMHSMSRINSILIRLAVRMTCRTSAIACSRILSFSPRESRMANIV